MNMHIGLNTCHFCGVLQSQYAFCEEVYFTNYVEMFYLWQGVSNIDASILSVDISSA